MPSIVGEDLTGPSVLPDLSDNIWKLCQSTVSQQIPVFTPLHSVQRRVGHKESWKAARFLHIGTGKVTVWPTYRVMSGLSFTASEDAVCSSWLPSFVLVPSSSTSSSSSISVSERFFLPSPASSFSTLHSSISWISTSNGAAGGAKGGDLQPVQP